MLTCEQPIVNSSKLCPKKGSHLIFDHFWIFEFHKVVQQYFASEVEIFVVCTDNFLTNQLVNFENQSTFAKVIIEHQVASFFGTPCTSAEKC